MQEFSKQKKVQTLESHQHFSFLSFPKTNKNTNNLPSFFFVYFLFISVHHYLLATMHFMCKQRRATTIFLISIDAQLLGKERTNERFSGMITDYGRPMKLFFIEIPNFGLVQTFWTVHFVGFGVFRPIYQHHFVAVSLLSMFFINQPLFLQKERHLHPNTKCLFGIGI